MLSFNTSLMGVLKGVLDFYDNWIRGVEQGHGSSHGNWWNGMVWAECRHFAAEYFVEIAKKYGEVISEAAQELNAMYSDISDMLRLVSDKEMDNKEKIRVLQELKCKEENTVKKLASFVDIIQNNSAFM